ncbi:hypothetical protein LTR66_002870 [Elasticomyces elasticus]|nr:hypothetical protein LTR28_006670 [Elasticomyces elasticus]KAK4997779.1 hypothetical protein LTR66_002870 [Elasticomyces elasticus]
MTKGCYARSINEICSAAVNFCYCKVKHLLDSLANRDDFYIDYLNAPKTQSTVGAYENFSQSARTVSMASGTTGDDDRESNTIEAVRALLEQGVTVTTYVGDTDGTIQTQVLATNAMYNTTLNAPNPTNGSKLLARRSGRVSVNMWRSKRLFKSAKNV